jgi:hypothetical protein
VDFAATDIKRDRIERDHAAEALGDGGESNYSLSRYSGRGRG